MVTSCTDTQAWCGCCQLQDEAVGNAAVTGAAPVDTKVTKYSVFTTTSPNGMAAALILSIGGVPFNCSVTVFETLPALASNITVCVEPTDDTVAVNPALVAFAGTVTVAGAQTAPLRARRCSAGKPSLPRGCVASCEFETLLGTNKTLTCPSTF